MSEQECSYSCDDDIINLPAGSTTNATETSAGASCSRKAAIGLVNAQKISKSVWPWQSLGGQHSARLVGNSDVHT